MKHFYLFNGRSATAQAGRCASIFCLIFAMLMTISVGEMWGAYYITGSNGNLTGWGTWNNMTESSDGMFWYFQAKSGNCEFKINTSNVKDSYTGALGASSRDGGFCDTDLGGNTWGNNGDGDNINYWYNDGNYYILVYVPNTTVNNTKKAKVCASTFLPDAGYETTNNKMKYYKNSDASDTYTGNLDRASGTTTALGSVTTLYLKGFESKMWRHGSGNIYGADAQHYYFKVHRTAVAAGSTGFTDARNATSYSAGSWSWGSWSSNYSYPTYSVSCNQNLLSGLGSGKYTMSYYFVQNGSKDFRLPSDGTKFNKLTWTIDVPAVSGGNVTSDGTGTGASGTPFSVADGEEITFTAGGSQASTDANSVLYVKWGSDDYGPASTTTKTITPTTTKQSMTVKLKYYNSADELSSEETTLTIYYQSTLTPSIGISSFTQDETIVTSVNSGESLTINASRQNAGTASITYQYSTNGSSWTTISSTTATSVSWTAPAVTSTTTYYIRAQMTYESTTYTSSNATLKIYGKKTIKVKNTNGWAYMLMHRWGGDRTGTSWPGESAQISAYGSGQWKQIVLYSSNTSFALVDGSNNDNHTADLTYASSVSDGSCYQIQSGTGGSLTLTSASCPEKPSVTTAAATSVATTNVTFNASSVSANNDAITAYGFAWGTTDACSSGTVTASNLGGGTSFSASKSSLTNGTTYYFKAYATNGQGTTYGDPVSVRTKFITTVTLNKQGGSDGTSEVTATEGSAMPSGKTAPSKTGYSFGGYYASAGGSGTQYYNSSMGSANNWDVAASTATIHAKWTAKDYTISLNQNGATTESDPTSLTATYDATAPVYDDGASAYKFNITNPEKTGYTFAGWFESAGGTGAEIITTYGFFKHEDNPYVDGTGHWTNDGDVTVYAKWTPNEYAVTLSTSSETGYGSSAPSNQTATYGAALPTITPPVGAAGYMFQGYFTGTGGTGTKYYNANGTSAKNWDIAEATTLHAYFQKAEISSLEHDATVAKDETAYLVVNPVLNVTPSDYTAICWTLHYTENDNEVAGANWSVASYTEDGTKPLQVRFTLNNMSVGSYYVQAVLKANATSFTPCSEGTEFDVKTGEFSIVGSSTVTIRYKELTSGADIAASSSVEIEAGGDADVVAPNIIGYTFNSWSVGAGITENSSDGSTINISSPYDGVITAFYTKKRLIYFKNTLNWNSVTVYFYKNDSYWGLDTNDGRGTGANTGYTFNNTPYGEGKHGAMTQIEGTDIWYFDAEAAGVNASYSTVVFTELDQHGYEWFAQTEGVNNKVIRRTDYKSTTLPMYVPLAGVEPESMNSDLADYYWQGYWMNYPDNTGYTLVIYDNTGLSAPIIKQVAIPYSADKKMPMSITTDLEGGKTYGFEIYRADNSYYGNSSTMTNGHSGDDGQPVWEFTHNAGRAGLTTTSAGNYTFTLNYGLDLSSNYNYLVGVRYPESTGDFRVQYKDNMNSTWKTSIVIPAITEADTVSYFVRHSSSPYIRVQKCTATYENETTTVTWDDENSGNNILTSALLTPVTEDGVYNFIFSKSDGALVLDKVEPYTGNFYIRVDGAGSTNWDNYRAADHIMPFSEYSFAQTTNPYSHYFAHFYDTSAGAKNIKFVVANDYSTNVSDTITQDGIADNYVDAEGWLSGRNANIRFMYNYKTNEATRRYLDGAQEDDSEFLLLLPSTNTSIYDAATDGTPYTQVKFSDKGNWVYEANVWVVPGTTYKLKAQFGEGVGTTITQYLKGKVDEYETLIGGSGARLQIRLIYDFKTNRLVTGYVPSGTIDANIELNADIMFVREHQGNVTQITFGENKSITEIKNVYTTLKFNKSTITNPGLSRYERDLYYISFPYDVLVSDIIGFGTYGTHWIIEYYDGAGRAEKGFWADSKSFWKFVTPAMKSTYKLKAGTGYIVALDLDEMESTDPVWENTETVELIFPGNISSISNQEVTYNMPSHQCNIGPRFEGGDDRRIADSHWNVLGVPAYHNTTGSFANHTDEIGETSQVWSASNAPNYLYTWNMTDNSLSVTNASGYEYKAMHAYMVQYYGDVTFHTSTNATPASVAARTYAEAPSEVQFRLEIQQNEVAVDQTFVTMSNDVQVSREFVFGEDMSKEFNKNKANIYTIVTSTIEGDATVTEVAGNTLPMTEQTTLVPVGVRIAANDDYTFSIPEGTEGVGVTLIDKERGTRTNISAVDYTVSLEAGTYDERFMLEFSPIHNAPTGTEQIQGDDGQSANTARKVLIDGLLYIVRDSIIYDARGARVE